MIKALNHEVPTGPKESPLHVESWNKELKLNPTNHRIKLIQPRRDINIQPPPPHKLNIS